MIDKSLFPHAFEPDLTAFLSSVDEGDRHWIWSGRVNPSGYGVVYIQGHTVTAHRVAHEWAAGPIHAWMEVDHMCRTQLCVNPDHLEAVTHLENVRRGKTAEALRANNHPLGLYLWDRAISLKDFADKMNTNVSTIGTMLRGHRPGNPDLVYRVGSFLGLSWEETDRIFPRRARGTPLTEPVANA